VKNEISLNTLGIKRLKEGKGMTEVGDN